MDIVATSVGVISSKVLAPALSNLFNLSPKDDAVIQNLVTPFIVARATEMHKEGDHSYDQLFNVLVGEGTSSQKIGVIAADPSMAQQLVQLGSEAAAIAAGSDSVEIPDFVLHKCPSCGTVHNIAPNLVEILK